MAKRSHPEGIRVRPPRQPRRERGSSTATDGCTAHRERCRFGRDHTWGIGYFDLDGVWHSAMICANCGGVCDAELRLDGEICACGTDPHQGGPSPFGQVR